MFLYLRKSFWKYKKESLTDQKRRNSISDIRRIRRKYNRKELLSPQISKYLQLKGIRTFFFASLRKNSPAFLEGTLTVETAMVLPLFLFCMTAVLQYGNVMETAVRFGSAMSETGKYMAVAAYLSKYGGDVNEAGEFAAAALSTAYAQNKVLREAGDISSVKNANMLLSSFLQEDEMLDLILTYQIRTPVTGIRLPWTFFIQRTKVRAWTGRESSPGGSKDHEKGEHGGEYVYVTATGSVYHEDTECTYLKLSVRPADLASLNELRNENGGIYHACEKCGDQAGGTVYITNEGSRYHSSLSCSGLKRTVKQVSREEAAHMRACSKCG